LTTIPWPEALEALVPKLQNSYYTLSINRPLARQTPPADHSRRNTIREAQKLKVPLLLLLVHIPLGLLLYQSAALALLHSALVLAMGLYYAVKKKTGLEVVACVVVYIAGVEVLWRMAGTSTFWEFGKYAASAIMIVALAKRKLWKFPTFPTLYIVLLIPACLLTLWAESLGDAKDKLSFNMSGPFTLFISCWFFSHLKIEPKMVKKLLSILVIPLISVSVTTLFYTLTWEIKFGNESNFGTSAGYGPNQVASVLGLGVFVCLASILLFKSSFKEIVFLSILVIFFTSQSALTFSRGGIYNALGATLAIILTLIGTGALTGIKRMTPVIGVGLLFLLLVFPYLNDFTGGALQDRFEDTDPTGRTEIVEADFQIFFKNPIIGAGVGEARALREDYFGKAVGAHTEFSRVFSEHGSIGIFALLALGVGVIYSFIGQSSSSGKALVIGGVVWSSLFMMNAGMRVAAPSIIWGIGFITIVSPNVRRRLYGGSLIRKNAPVPALS
jgi:hypothetical protein